VPAKPATKPVPAPTADVPIDAERLAEEVALVDQARGALARGDARAALAALDDYDARFKVRRFAPEALYLKMESLLRLGNADAARAVAERLATSFPKSPHTARARQVLGAIP
jgi:TolA-binding protein